MAGKVSIVLDEDVKNDLDTLVKSGNRSRLINEALRKELLNIRRKNLSAELDKLRKKTTAVSTRELVDLLRRDRKR